VVLRRHNLIQQAEGVVGKGWVVTKEELIEPYLRDETPEPIRPSPAGNLILIKPSTTEQVSRILKLANEQKISIFPVGGRTGLVGGAVPTEPGIVLSLERMNRVEIDRRNPMAIIGAGATLKDLIEASDDADLFFPLHPGDEGAQIGGLIATNAGGVRAVKYGVMRSYVKGVDAVLPTGEVLKLGGRLIKNNTGYDLMDLIVGSEGTLCVIVKAVIKLYPRSKFKVTLVVPFDNRLDALTVVPRILQSGVIPLAIEYVEMKDIAEAAEHLGEEWPVHRGEAQLIMVLTGTSYDVLLLGCEEISQVCEQRTNYEPLIAETREEQDRILRIRSNIYNILKPKIVDVLDVTVPPSNLGRLIVLVEGIASKYGVQLSVCGHAGDGNLHVSIMKEEKGRIQYVAEAKKKIYETTVALEGAITGEHGIGKLRTSEIGLVLSPKEIELMKTIKGLFDPNNILNPGNVFPQDRSIPHTQD